MSIMGHSEPTGNPVISRTEDVLINFSHSSYQKADRILDVGSTTIELIRACHRHINSDPCKNSTSAMSVKVLLRDSFTTSNSSQ